MLARLLPGLEVHTIDAALGMRAGTLLAEAGTADVVDAAVVLLARDGDEILTSDAHDLAALAEARGVHVDLIPI